MLHVAKVPSEPTRFWVESHALQCVRCGKLVERYASECMEFNGRQRALLRKVGVWDRIHRYLEGRKIKAVVGCPCTRKGCEGILDVRFHLVDIATYNCNGSCGCEYFGVTLRKQAEQADKAAQGAGLFRCSHIDAARDFALDVSLRAHEQSRLNGHSEENQP